MSNHDPISREIICVTDYSFRFVLFFIINTETLEVEANGINNY